MMTKGSKTRIVLATIVAGCISMVSCGSDASAIRHTDTYENMLWNWNDFESSRQRWICDKFENDRPTLVHIFADEGIPPKVTTQFLEDMC